jgi:hypothetical protein
VVLTQQQEVKMSYRYDSYLVIANKFSSASSDAKAQLFETYDQLRNISVSDATGSNGSGAGTAGGFLYNMAQLFSPSSFMPTTSGTNSYSIPGTSYWSPSAGATSSSSFGLETYSGFAAPMSGYAPGEAASILSGYGSETGYASNIGGIANIANAAAFGTGTASGFSGVGQSIVLSGAGLIAGIGGIMQSAAPYMGEYGIGAIVAGNLMSGAGGAALAAVQGAAAKVSANADVILTNKVKNIETVCKMLDTQGDVVKYLVCHDCVHEFAECKEC